MTEGGVRYIQEMLLQFKVPKDERKSFKHTLDHNIAFNRLSLSLKEAFQVMRH